MEQLTDEEKSTHLKEIGYSETETIFGITHEKTNDFYSRLLQMDEYIGINFLNTIYNGKGVQTIWTTPRKLLEVLEKNRHELMTEHPRSN